MHAIALCRDVADITPDTTCTFIPDASEHVDESWSAVGIDSDSEMDEHVRYATAAAPGTLKLWPWVNRSPLSVSPRLPLEFVMQLFKRMGYASSLLFDIRGSDVGLGRG